MAGALDNQLGAGFDKLIQRGNQRNFRISGSVKIKHSDQFDGAIAFQMLDDEAADSAVADDTNFQNHVLAIARGSPLIPEMNNILYVDDLVNKEH